VSRSCGANQPSASLRLLHDVPASPRRGASHLAGRRSQPPDTLFRGSRTEYSPPRGACVGVHGKANDTGQDTLPVVRLVKCGATGARACRVDSCTTFEQAGAPVLHTSRTYRLGPTVIVSEARRAQSQPAQRVEGLVPRLAPCRSRHGPKRELKFPHSEGASRAGIHASRRAARNAPPRCRCNLAGAARLRSAGTLVPALAEDGGRHCSLLDFFTRAERAERVEGPVARTPPCKTRYGSFDYAFACKGFASG